MKIRSIEKETAFIYSDRQKLFGSLIDIFVGKHPLKPITSLLSYCKRNAILPTSLELMTFDLNYSVEYLKQHLDSIDNLGITLIGNGSIKNGIYNQDGLNINIKKTKQTLEEHINIIHAEDGKIFIWHEPLHIVDEEGDFFGYEIDASSDDENNLAAERLRARLYEPNEEQLVNINKKIENMLVH